MRTTLFHAMILFALLIRSADGHAAPVSALCPAPVAGWYSPASGKTDRDIKWDVRAEGRSIRFNDAIVDLPTLAGLLRQGRRMTPRPLLRYDPSQARDCRFATAVRDAIDRGFDCRANTCWQGTEAQFRATPVHAGETIHPW